MAADMKPKRIGILTGGGDAPGLNAVIRAVVLTAAHRRGWEVVGIRQGYDGLLTDPIPTLPLDETHVRDLLTRGGTVLGAVNRGNPLLRSVERPDGTVAHVDASGEAVAQMARLGIDALIVAGGDGTMAIAQKLIDLGAHVVGVPKTIDNDLSETDVTFGFDTAVLTATEALDKLQTTAASHHRVMVMEVMGRNSGWLALTVGVAGGADAILIPEIPYDIGVVFDRIQSSWSARNYSLVVVAEGAAPVGGSQEYYIQGHGAMQSRLGGVGFVVGNMIVEALSVDVRVTVLGHLQRGGQPTPRDRWLATRFGSAAVRLVEQEQWGKMVALHGDDVVAVPMSAAAQVKMVDPDGELVQMARDLGIAFG